MVVASASLIGGHLWHLVLLVAWTPIFAAVFLFERITARRRTQRTPSADGGVDGGISSDLESVTARRPRSSWLQATALAAFGAALVHIAVMPDHFKESVVYGLFFLVASTGQAAFGVLILVKPSRQLIAAGIVGSALLIILWTISRLWGVPIGPDNGATESIGLLDVLATSYEAATVVFGLLAIRSWTPRPAWRWSTWTPMLRVLAPLCVVGTVVASIFGVRS